MKLFICELLLKVYLSEGTTGLEADKGSQRVFFLCFFSWVLLTVSKIKNTTRCKVLLILVQV